jgi:dipeptidyl aminopeptidase/acylaminoacyl peptidase
MVLPISKIVKIVESLVYTPTYTLLGIDLRNRVVYETMEGGFKSIWALDTDGSRKRLVNRIVHWTSEVSKDRSRISFTVDVGNGRELQILGFVYLTNDKEVVLEGMEPVRVLGFADDGKVTAFAGATATEVALYVAKSGSVEKLTKLDTYAHVTDFNGELVVGSGNLAKNPRSSEIFVYSLRENSMHIFTPHEGSVNENPVIIDEDKVLFETNVFNSDYKELMIYNVKSGEIEKLRLDGRDYYEYKPVEHLYYRQFCNKFVVIGKKNGRSKVFINGYEAKIPEGMILNAYLVNNTLYYTYSSLTKPTRIMRLVDGRNEEVLGAKLDKDIENAFSEVKFVKIKSFDDIEIPTFIVTSSKAESTKTVVIFVHGGPWWEVADEWNLRIAPLVVAGFNVVAPNFRGSTGYGERFRLLDIGDPGDGDLQDIAYVTKWALENRLGEKAFIWGYSYGGYITLLSMFRLFELFKCGVAGAPVADWEEMYELSDAVFKQFINILFNNKRELWKERSPSTYAENLSNPLCVIEPQNDSRTPLKPVLNLIEKLMNTGKTFELHVLPEAGHAITVPDKLAWVLILMLNFFNKCLER